MMKQLLLIFLISIPLLGQTRIYVDSMASGTNDGTSWANAYNSFATALGSVSGSDTLWVAKGTYTPNAGPRSNSFILPAATSVSIYGGFAGGETTLSQRDPKLNRVVFSGDHQGTPGDNTDNVYHVFSVNSNLGQHRFFGVTIRGGYANGGGVDNFGAGVLNESPTEGMVFTNVTFIDNYSIDDGAAIYGGSVGSAGYTVIYSEFINNVTTTGNGAAFASQSNGNLDFVSNLFENNSAGDRGGAVYAFNTSRKRFVNNIFYKNNTNASGADGGGALWINTLGTGGFFDFNTVVGNTAPSGVSGGIQIDLATGANAANNNIFYANTSTIGGSRDHVDSPANTIGLANNVISLPISNAVDNGSNLNVDPLLVDTANNDFRLFYNSLAVDGGSASLPPDFLDLDFDANLAEDFLFDFNGDTRVIGPNANIGALEAVVNPLLVSSTSDLNVVGTLRYAINEANTNAGPDTITFDVALLNQTITVLSPLPSITDDSLYIDGDINGDDLPSIVIDGNGINAHAFQLNNSNYSTVKNLNIQSFNGSTINRAIMLINSDNNRLVGNYIGTNLAGTDTTGTSVSSGIYLDLGSDFNVVGDSLVNYGNLLSGITFDAITIYNSDFNNVFNNKIGTNLSGNAPLGQKGSGQDGIFISGGASWNYIGNASPSGRNIIADINQNGVIIAGAGTRENVVQGNYIGLLADGVTAAGNTDGIAVQNDARANIIGGTGSVGTRNVISGNSQDGIAVYNTDSLVITNNIIGMTAAGNVARQNTSSGIEIDNSRYIRVGDLSPNGANYISGNFASGVEIRGIQDSLNVVEGNFIGLQLDEVSALGNQSSGVAFLNSAHRDTVRHNVIAFNGNNATESGIIILHSNVHRIVYHDNEFYSNFYKDIHVTSGGQGGITPPTIDIVNADSTVSGTYVDNSAGEEIDLYIKSANSMDFVESIFGSAGIWNSLSAVDLALGDSLVAIVRDMDGNSSEFSAAVPAAIIDPFLVTSTSDDFVIGTLRYAINEANSDPAPNFIQFDSTLVDQTIVLTGDLPTISDNGTIIDGTTNQAANDSMPHITIDGSAITQSMIDVSADSVVIRYINFVRSANYTVQLSSGSEYNHIYGNFFGTGLTGNDTTGGTINTRGLYLSSNADNNIIGDTLGLRPNVFAGAPNYRSIYTQNASNNTIAGNIIGVSRDYSVSFNPIPGQGIYLQGGINNRIGTPNIGGYNVIAGMGGASGDGILLNSSSQTTIVNNYLGITPNGNVYANRYGVNVSSSSNSIGDSIPYGRNFISGNDWAQINLNNNADDNYIYNNYIGTDLTGNASAGGTADGIRINGQNNHIGDGLAIQRNVISGNAGYGISVQDSSNVVNYNFIGVGADGSTVVPNLNTGIYVFGLNGSSQIIVENDIANNGDAAGEYGIRIENSAIQNVRISGNRFYNNYSGAIFKVAGSQNNIPAPTITYVSLDSTVSGTSLPNSEIELLAANGPNEALGEVGFVVADGTGNWSIPNVDLGVAANLTALQIDGLNNTSILSAPVASMGVDPFVVTTTSDHPDSIGSLRFAIMQSNLSAEIDTITFALAPSSVIVVDSILPADSAVVITDDSGLNITIQAAGGFSDQFVIGFGDGAWVSNLSFDGNGAAQAAIKSEGVAGSVFDNLEIHGHTLAGILIGETDTLQNSHIYSNGQYGAGSLQDGKSYSYFINNRIGTNASGTASAGGQKVGVLANAYLNLQDNVISGNDSIGVIVNGSDVELFRNHIGLNAAGDGLVANTHAGIWVDATRTQIGDGTYANRNMIAGATDGTNGFAIRIDADSTQVLYNYIGMTSDGLSSIANREGIHLESDRNQITNNYIGSNSENGIHQISFAFNNLYAYNIIGYGADTLTNMGNGTTAMLMEQGSNNIVQHNLFANSGLNGLHLGVGSDNEIFTLANVFHNNAGEDIAFNVGVQSSIPPATWSTAIDGSNTVTGVAGGNSGNLVALYIDSTFIDTTRTSTGAIFSYTFTNQELTYGDSIRVLYDDGLNTSQFSAGNSTYYADPLVVTSTSDANVLGTLRYAIAEANSNAGPDTIRFDATIQDATITIATNLPPITDNSTVITGDIDNDSIPSIRIVSASGGNNIFTLNADSAVIEFVNLANAYRAILLNTGAQYSIIRGNYIGTTLNGLDTLGSLVETAVHMSTTNDYTMVGDTLGELGNVFVATNRAVYVNQTSYNHIAGNIIGMSADESTPFAGSVGIEVANATYNTIGSQNGLAGNIVGNQGTWGIYLRTGADNNMIAANYVGLNASDIAHPNATGIFIEGADFNTIGDTTAVGSGNVISGNTNIGVRIGSGAIATVVQNNLIGTNSAGTAALGSQASGISIIQYSQGTLIGGNSPNASNIISGNGVGILTNFADATYVMWNMIGLDITGSNAIPNTGFGIDLTSAVNSVIGAAGTGNYISGNGDSGIRMRNADSLNTIEGNFIGLEIDGITAAGNGSHGIEITNNASLDEIYDNVIAYNSGDGVYLDGTPDRISIYQNSIHDNTGNAVNTNGGNNGIAPPVITSFLLDSTLTGTAAANSDVDISLDNGAEAAYYYGTVTADALGNWSLSSLDPQGFTNITAIQTDLNGNSSEFSVPLAATPMNPLIVSNTADNNVIGSLRFAVDYANNNAGRDTITFSPSIINSTITLNSELTLLDDGTVINGDVDGNMSPSIRLVRDDISGSLFAVSSDSNAFAWLNLAHASSAIVLYSGRENTQVYGNFIGLTLNGQDTVASSIQTAVFSAGNNHNTIVGDTLGNHGNVIHTTGNAIRINGTNSYVSANIIGMSNDESIMFNNSSSAAIIVANNNNTVGGLTAGAGNVIGNYFNGINISNSAQYNRVFGNIIGLNSSGIHAPNSNSGIYIEGSFSQIGDSLANARNIITGNTSTQIIVTGSSANRNNIANNYIGTTIDGLSDGPGTGSGITIIDANRTSVGNEQYNGWNIISGNGTGVFLSNADSTLIMGNNIGGSADNSSVIGNGAYGVHFTDSRYGDVGSTQAGSENIIVGAAQAGINFNTNSHNNRAINNFIGTDTAGVLNGPTNVGIRIEGSSSNELIAFNTITNNTDGFRILGAATDSTQFFSNSVFNNTSYGYYDAGAQQSVSAPTLSHVGLDSVLHGTSSPNAFINIYADAGNQAELWIDTVFADGSGNFSYKIDPSSGAYFTATQDSMMNTSLLSNAITSAPVSPLLVTNILDDNSFGSLRFAVNHANTNADADTIRFDASLIGSTIVLNSSLSLSDNGIFLSGEMNDSTARINLTAASNTFSGINISADSVTVQFLSFTGFGNGALQAAILVNGTDQTRLVGNLIGLELDGTTADGNHDGIIAYQTTNLVIGDSLNHTLGNYISSNSNNGITLIESPHAYLGENTIGSDAIGTGNRGNGVMGIQLDSLSHFSRIEHNQISGSGIAGLTIARSDSVTIESNLIGTSNNGTAAIPNQYGLYLLAASTGLEVHRNLISGNGQNAIYAHLNDTTGSSIYGMSIIGNHIGLSSVNTILGNGGTAILLDRGVENAQIGDGTKEGANVIAGNGGSGVHFRAFDYINDQNIVNWNYFGTDSAEVVNAGNNGHGILIEGNVSGLAVTNSVFTNNNLDGIRLNDGAPQFFQHIDNSFYNNTGRAVTFAGGANGGVPAPTITALLIDSTLSGTAAANAIVVIYADNADDAEFYVDTVSADGSGDWVLSVDPSIATNLTAYQVVPGVGASAFSTPFASVLVDPFVVTSTADANVLGTLRFAVNEANSNAGPDTIIFAPSIQDSTIVLGGFLQLTDNGTVINGDVNGDNIPSIRIENSVSPAPLFNVNADSTTITMLNLAKSSTAIDFQTGSSYNHVLANYIGLSLNGLDTVGSQVDIAVYNFPNTIGNIVGDTLGLYGNVITTASDAIIIQGRNNHISANTIGMSADQTSQFGNNSSNAITFAGSVQGTVIGGYNPGAGNIIGNYSTAVNVSGMDSIKILGNTIGMNSSGASHPNNVYGISLSNSMHILIGDTFPNARNIISSNNTNIFLTNADSNRISNNIIGLRSNGTVPTIQSNNALIIQNGSDYNKIGVIGANGRNIISGHADRVIWLTGTASNSNQFVNNYIGTDIAGTSGIANTGGNAYGIHIQSGTNNEIGNGSGAGRNIIGANAQGAIQIETTMNTVSNNFIGIGADSLASIPNSGTAAVSLFGSNATYNQITQNIIANNSTPGIQTAGGAADNNHYYANSIYNNAGKGINQVSGQNGIGVPIITTIGLDSVITGTSSFNHLIQIYADYGSQGQFLLDTVSAIGFDWSKKVDLNVADSITVLMTNKSTGNTSEFSSPIASVAVDPLVVTKTNDDGSVGTLRYAIDHANNTSGIDIITFGFSNDTVRIDTVLYMNELSGARTIIDGQSNNIVLAATSSFPSGDRSLITIESPYQVIRNLELNGAGNARHGIFFDNPGNGDDSKAENLYVYGFDNGIIGDAERDSVINSTISMNNFVGVNLGEYAHIEGNAVGTDQAGNAGLYGQKFGVGVGAYSQIINNTVSGNDSLGIIVSGRESTLLRNRVGTNLSGTSSIPNNFGGVYIELAATATIIGDGTNLNRNIISGNTGRVGLSLRSDSNIVDLNYIGTDISGSIALPNLHGIEVYLSDNNFVTRNIVSGNTDNGVRLNNDSKFNIIEDNIVGAAVDTVSVLSNSSGFYFESSSRNMLSRNMINFNSFAGVLTHSTDSLEQFIVGNIFIGNTNNISLDPSSQESVLPPVINAIAADSTLNGIAAPNALIALYTDPTGADLSNFVDTVRADGGGSWSYKMLDLSNAYALALQDSAGNTSEESAAFIMTFNPIVSASTSLMDFGAQSFNNAFSDTLTIYNSGNAVLTIDSISIDGLSGAVYTDETLVGVNPVAVGDSIRLPISFFTNVIGTFNDSIRINTNDPITPELAIFVTGQGQNDAPVVSMALNDTSFNEDNGLTLVDVLSDNFSDPNNTNLTYSANILNLPEGTDITVHISTSNDSLFVNTAADSAGLVQIEIVASDGALQVRDTMNVTYIQVNDAPVFSAIPTVNIAEDTTLAQLIDLAPYITDVENDVITFSTIAATGYIAHNYSGTSMNFSSMTTNYNGPDTVTVEANDGQGGLDTIQVVFNIEPRNDVPTNSPPSGAAANEDAPELFLLVTTDEFTDIDGDSLTFTITGNDNPGLGNFSFRGDSLFFLVNPDSSGIVNYTIRATDPELAYSEQTYGINISPVNDAPVFTQDLYVSALNEDSPGVLPISTMLDTLVSDVDFDSYTFNVISQASHATISMSGGVLNFNGTSTPNFFGLDTAQLEVVDGSGLRDTTFVFLTFNPVNDAPNVYPTAVTTVNLLEDDPEYFVGIVDSLFEDVDGDLIDLSVQSVSNAAALTASVRSDSLFVTPATDSVGSVAVTVRGADPLTLFADHAFTVNIAPVNDAPIFNGSLFATVIEDQNGTFPITTMLDTAVTDVDFDSYTFNIVTSANHAALGIATTNLVFSNSTTPNFNGLDSVEIEVVDGGGLRDTTMFYITFTPVNDAPNITTAIADVTFAEDTTNAFAFAMPAHFADVDGDSLTLYLFDVNNGQILNGYSVRNDSIFYNTMMDSVGTATIAAHVTDGALFAMDTFNITIDPRNDGPFLINPVPDIVVNEDSIGFMMDISSFFGDVDTMDVLTGIVTPLTNASLFDTLYADASGTLFMNPETDSNGVSLIELLVNDGNGGEVRDTIQVTVNAVNDIPAIVLNNNDITVNEDTTPYFIPNFSSRVRDADGDSLLISTNVIQGASFATSEYRNDSMIVSILPDSNGIALIEFVTDDQVGGVLRDTMVYTVTPVDDQPIFVGGSSVTLAEDTGKVYLGSYSELFRDADGTQPTITVTYSPSIVSSYVNNDSLFVETIQDLNGLDSLVLQAQDGGTPPVNATITFTIDPRNDLPAVLGVPALSFNEDAGEQFVSLLSDLFSDVDGDPLTFTSMITSGQMSMTSDIRGDSLFVTSAPDSNGTSGITVYAMDGSGDTVSTMGSVIVNAVNDAPVIIAALPDTVTIVEFSPESLIDYLGDNFRDIEREAITLSYSVIDFPNRVNTRFADDSLFVTSIKDSLGAATIEIVATDAQSAQTRDTVVVNVLDFPNAFPALVSTTLQNGLRAKVYNGTDSVRASDADNNPLTYALISGPTWLSMDANGAITGTPLNVGLDSLDVTVTDGYETVPARIYITIDNVQLLSNATVADTLIIGHNGFAYQRQLQSVHGQGTNYRLASTTPSDAWLSFADTTFSLLGSQNMDLTVNTAALPRTTETLQTMIHIIDESSSIVVDSFAVSLTLDRLVDYMVASIPSDSINRQVYSGLVLNETLTVTNNSEMTAASIDVTLSDNSGWITLGQTSLNIADASSANINIEFDFTAMSETDRTGTIYVVDTEFAADTIASISYAFTKELIGRAVFTSILKDSIHNQELTTTGFIMEWGIENGIGELTTQLTLSRDGNIIEQLNNQTDYIRDYTNLADGSYELVVRVQDSLNTSYLSETGNDTILFSIVGAKETLAPGFWTLVTPVTSSTGRVSSLVTGSDVSTYYVYDNNEGDYVSANSQTLNAGKAYWLKVKAGQDSVVNFSYDTNKLIGDSITYELDVVQGWNLIGSPWNYDIYVQGLEIEDTLTGQFMSFVDADASDLVELHEYMLEREDTVAGYSYMPIVSDQSIFKAKKGYWLKSNVDRKIRFKSVQRYNNNVTPKANRWSATLSLKMENSVENIRFSMSEHVVNQSLAKLPPALSRKAFTAALEGEYGHARVPYDATVEKHRYELTIRSNKSRNVELNYNEIAQGLEQYVFVQQLQTGRVIKLSPENRVERIDLTRKEETVLVYVSANPDFEVPVMPVSFDLHQNYPNPFNPTTKIVFDLPYTRANYDVTVEIFNILGQRVKTLVKGKLESRRHEYVWNGRNDVGQRVASGMYFYTIKAGTYFKAKKMVLIK